MKIHIKNITYPMHDQAITPLFVPFSYHEIGSLQIILSINEKEFLFESCIHVHPRVLRLPQHLKESHTLA